MSDLESCSDLSDLSDYYESDEDFEMAEDVSPLPNENFAKIVDIGKFINSFFFCQTQLF